MNTLWYTVYGSSCDSCSVRGKLPQCYILLQALVKQCLLGMGAIDQQRVCQLYNFSTILLARISAAEHACRICLNITSLTRLASKDVENQKHDATGDQKQKYDLSGLKELNVAKTCHTCTCMAVMAWLHDNSRLDS